MSSGSCEFERSEAKDWGDFFDNYYRPSRQAIEVLKVAVLWNREKPEQFLTNCMHLLEVGLSVEGEACSKSFGRRKLDDERAYSGDSG